MANVKISEITNGEIGRNLATSDLLEIETTGGDSYYINGTHLTSGLVTTALVSAVGAVMLTDFNAQTILSAVVDNTPTALTITEESVVGRITGGNVGAINPSTVRRPITTLTTGTIFSLSHAGNIVEMNSTNTVYLTIPINAGIAFPVGTAIDIVQYGVAGVNVTTSVGVTLVRRAAFTLALAGQYSVATIYKRATDEWVLAGDLTTA
jgi:hypothetical protein